MKQLFFFPLFVLALLSCQKIETSEPVDTKSSFSRPNPYFGTLAATRNRKQWQALVYASPELMAPSPDRFGLSFDILGKVGERTILRELLVFGNLKYGICSAILEDTKKDSLGQYNNNGEYVKYTQWYEDGDVLSSPYTLMATEPHTIEITEFNNSNKEFKGIFQVTLVSKIEKDTFRFAGEFNSKVW